MANPAPRPAPSADLAGHLVFALRYEGLDLLIPKRMFQTVGARPIEAIVCATPTGSYARRPWFLYESLLGRQLDLPAAPKSAYVPVVDPQQQYAAGEVTSTRHRVRNNLPGTPSFAPLSMSRILWTPF
jgi:hypothetical protein